MAGLGLGLGLSVAAPFVIFRFLLPDSVRHTGLYAAGALVVAFALFGLSLTR